MPMTTIRSRVLSSVVGSVGLGEVARASMASRDDVRANEKQLTK